jgi:competence protein ComEA
MQTHSRLRAAAGLIVLVAFALSAAAPALAAAPSQKDSRASSSAPVDLNAATADRLTTVPGIGKVMAQRIVDWRDEHGPFRRVEDLMKVKGVGEKTLEKLRPYVKVGKSR